MKGLCGEHGLALVGCWPGREQMGMNSANLGPLGLGTVHSTDISYSVCLQLTPYLRSPSTLTCFSSHSPFWWTSPTSTHGLPGSAGPGSGFRSHSALLCTLCPTHTEIFTSRNMPGCFVALPFLLLLFQSRIPALSCPAVSLSRVQLKQHFPLQSLSRSSLHPHPTPPLPFVPR